MPGKTKSAKKEWVDGPRGGQYRTERVGGEERKIYRRKPKAEREAGEKEGGHWRGGYGWGGGGLGWGLPLAAATLGTAALVGAGGYGYGRRRICVDRYTGEQYYC